MIGYRWTLGYQEAFEKFLTSPENNNEEIFNNPQLEKIDLPLKATLKPINHQKDKPLQTSNKDSPREGNKKGRPKKINTPPDRALSTSKKAKDNVLSHGQDMVSTHNQLQKSGAKGKRDSATNLSSNKLLSTFNKSKDEMSNKTDNRERLGSEISKVKMETNEFATKCPYCNFWKLNSEIEEHVRCCRSSSTSVSVPYESFYRAVDNMHENISDEMVSPKDPKNSTKKNKISSSQKNVKSNLMDTTKEGSPKENIKKSKINKSKSPVEKDIDLREFYFERPKRKAHDAALQSCKEILNEEANTKNEDFKFYKKFRKNSGDLNPKQQSDQKKDLATGFPPDSKDTNNSDVDDDVAQLANDLIQNWDTKELMNEEFDIGPSILQSMTQFENMEQLFNPKHQMEKLKGKKSKANTRGMNMKPGLSEDVEGKGFEVYRINGAHSLANDNTMEGDSTANPGEGPMHCCNECNFTTYSEVALNTHTIIYH